MKFNGPLCELVALARTNEDKNAQGMFEALGGNKTDLVETIIVAQDEFNRARGNSLEQIGTLVSLIELGSIIGHYYALKTYDAKLGIGQEPV